MCHLQASAGDKFTGNKWDRHWRLLLSHLFHIFAFLNTGCFSVFIIKMIAKIKIICAGIYYSKACATPILVMGLFPLHKQGFLMIPIK